MTAADDDLDARAEAHDATPAGWSGALMGLPGAGLTVQDEA